MPQGWSLFLEDRLTGDLHVWGTNHTCETVRRFRSLFVMVDHALFQALRRARIKSPRGPEARLSSAQYAKLMAGLDEFDQIHIRCGVRDARIEPPEVLEESRRLPEGLTIVERNSHAGH
jgi:hypothetical protein